MQGKSTYRVGLVGNYKWISTKKDNTSIRISASLAPPSLGEKQHSSRGRSSKLELIPKSSVACRNGASHYNNKARVQFQQPWTDAHQHCEEDKQDFLNNWKWHSLLKRIVHNSIQWEKNTRTLGLRKYARGYLWCYTCLQILQNISRKPNLWATPPIRRNWNLKMIQLSTFAHHLLKLKTPAGFGLKHFGPSGALGVTVLVVLASPRCENTSLATCSKLIFFAEGTGCTALPFNIIKQTACTFTILKKKSSSQHMFYLRSASAKG